MNRMIAASMALALMAPGVASAATYDVYNDFGTSVFTYGYGTGGTSFTAFSRTGAACGIGNALTCADNGAGTNPSIAKNGNGTTYTEGTVAIPAMSVQIHPGTAASGQDAIVRFVAPVEGLYTITGSWARNDVTANGNGTTASIWAGSTLLSTTALGTGSYGSSSSFGTITTTLAAGGVLDFALNNNGEFSYDSTRLNASIAAPDVAGPVPEPATWGMMILGFGAIGATLRVRRRTVRFA